MSRYKKYQNGGLADFLQSDLAKKLGKGAMPVEATVEAIEPLFSEARWTAPANGLILESVHYPGPGEPLPEKP